MVPSTLVGGHLLYRPTKRHLERPLKHFAILEHPARLTLLEHLGERQTQPGVLNADPLLVRSSAKRVRTAE